MLNSANGLASKTPKQIESLLSSGELKPGELFDAALKSLERLNEGTSSRAEEWSAHHSRFKEDVAEIDRLLESSGKKIRDLVSG